MASLMRWDPFRDLIGLQRDVDRLLTDFGGWRIPSGGDGGKDLTLTPTTDVLTRGEDMVIRVELPGVKTDDVEISVTDNVLSLRAERHKHSETRDEDYLVRETSWGSMERSFRLPEGVKVDDIHADFADGILEVVVPKAAAMPERSTRKIEIGAQGGKELTEHH